MVLIENTLSIMGKKWYNNIKFRIGGMAIRIDLKNIIFFILL